MILAEHADKSRVEEFRLLVADASSIPAAIAHLAAGEIDLAQVLAELFSLMTSIRLLTTNNSITKDTGRILVGELEALAEKLDASTRLSPFVTSEDFLIPPMSERVTTPLPAVSNELVKKTLSGPEIIKDMRKGQPHPANKEQQNRSIQILMFVRENKGVSIKDIAAVVKDCSEKTIQRELNVLISEGLVRRVGERRWSLYEAVPGAESSR